MPENYVLLERTELNASAASVTFANIPQTGYTDLKIVMSSRTDQTGSSGQDVYVRFNGDSGANYSFRRLYGNGSSAASDAVSSSSTAGRIGRTNSVNATANTFASAEFYIPNYTGSTAKSISGDAVDETNATGAIAQLTATIWTGTASITSMQLFPFSSGTNFLANSTFSLYGLAALGTTPAIAPKAYGGNVIATDGTYWYHAFLSSGNFVPQTPLNADCLVIAGGGSGGTGNGPGSGNSGGAGGGGAGGLVAYTAQPLTAINYSITVGAGGAAVTGSSNGNVGNNSQFAALTASAGGGYGAGNAASGTQVQGGTGGSGGGSANWNINSTLAGGTASPAGQGNAGGSVTGNGGGNFGGGGGGAGGVGGQSSVSAGAPYGSGGAGSSSYSSWLSATSTGVSGLIAGGGGGGTGATGAGSIVSGGGGAGSNLNANGTSGTANTGGGGGGGGSGFTSGAGGSGIVIIRYPIAS